MFKPNQLPEYYLDTNVIDFDLYVKHLIEEFIEDEMDIPAPAGFVKIIIDTANDNRGHDEVLEILVEAEDDDLDEFEEDIADDD